jgi:hypothetical protein
MSVLEDVRRFEEGLVERLRELEPLIHEYDQLRAVAQQLGVSYTPGEQPAPANAPGRRISRRPAGASTDRSPAAAKPASPPDVARRPGGPTRR